MYEYHGNKGSRRQQEIKEPLTLYRAGGFLFISCRRYQTDHLQIYSGGVRILNVQLEESEAEKREFFKTSKKNKELHGLGIKCIDNVILKYDGHKEYSIQKDNFQMYISLPLD